MPGPLRGTRSTYRHAGSQLICRVRCAEPGLRTLRVSTWGGFREADPPKITD